MSRIRLGLLGLVAVLAVSGIASASASALTPQFLVCMEKSGGKFEDSKCSKEGTSKLFEESEVTTPLKIEGTSGSSTLKSVILKEEINIECTKDSFTGEIEAGGKTKGEVKFKGCSVTKPAGCTVKEPIEFKFTDQLINSVAEKVEDEFKGTEAEEGFVELELKVCALKGKYRVKGTQDCTLGAKGGEEQIVEHEIVCTPSGSKLKIGKEVASFTSTEKVKLENKDAWEIKFS